MGSLGYSERASEKAPTAPKCPDFWLLEPLGGSKRSKTHAKGQFGLKSPNSPSKLRYLLTQLSSRVFRLKIGNLGHFQQTSEKAARAPFCPDYWLLQPLDGSKRLKTHAKGQFGLKSPNFWSKLRYLLTRLSSGLFRLKTGNLSRFLS